MPSSMYGRRNKFSLYFPSLFSKKDKYLNHLKMIESCSCFDSFHTNINISLQKLSSSHFTPALSSSVTSLFPVPNKVGIMFVAETTINILLLMHMLQHDVPICLAWNLFNKCHIDSEVLLHSVEDYVIIIFWDASQKVQLLLHLHVVCALPSHHNATQMELIAMIRPLVPHLSTWVEEPCHA